MQLRQVRDIEYQLLPGSDRQTTDIVIERDGVITVRPPKRMTPEQVDETVLSKRMWIYRNLAEWRDLNATRVTREWVSGETFLYLGSCYRLQLVAEQDEPLKLKDGRFCLMRDVVARGGQEAAHRAFEEFYKAKDYHDFGNESPFASKVGVSAGDIQVKGLGYRWASCSKTAICNSTGSASWPR